MVKKVGDQIFETCLSKIELGLLGYLWCQGEKVDKANFLMSLLNFKPTPVQEKEQANIL